MSENKPKPIRLVEYLTRLASLRTKIVKDVAEYRRTLWIHDIPKEKCCFARAWGDPEEEYDQDIWIEVQLTSEPEFPNVPEICRDWVNWDIVKKTDDLPEIINAITRQVRNPEWKEGMDRSQFINQTIQLEDRPEVKKAWEIYIEQKWIPWAEQHQKWEKVHKVYSELFDIHQEQLKLGEEYELVLGIGMLTWQTPSNQRVRRHLIVANALLEFEARLRKFTVRPNIDDINLRPELDMLDIEEQPAVQAEEAEKDSLKDAADNPWNRDYVEGAIKILVHFISPYGEYHERLETKRAQSLEKPIVEYAPALILRKRSVRGLTEILKRIRERIESGEEIPSEFADLAEISKYEGRLSSEVEDGLDLEINGEIYFPKPSNEEQRRIVEKIRSANGVLVQGPPGTGKSHTIANLICHLLATGQRTLITAKTPRALKVLEKLLPEEMRPLCINLLGSGLEERQFLEASVSAILQKNEQWKEDLSQEKIREQEGYLHQLRQEKAKIENRLRAIRESETHSYTATDGAYRGTAAQIAQLIKSDECKYGWFTDMVPLDRGCPIPEEEFSRLLKGLRALTHEKREELDLLLPSSIPSVQLFESLVEQKQKAVEQENSTLAGIDNDFLKEISCLDEQIVKSIQESFAKLLYKVSRLKSMPHVWISDAVQDALSKNSGVWQELHNISQQIITNIAEIVQKADSTEIVLPEDRDLKTVLEDGLALKEHLINGGRIGWGPFRSKDVKSILYLIKNVKVNGRLCNKMDRITLLVEVLRVKTELERGWKFWAGRTEKIEGPCSLQFRALKSLSEALSEALSLSNEINRCEKVLSKCSPLSELAWYEESRMQTLVNTCTHVLAKAQRAKAEDEVKQVVKHLIAAITDRVNIHPVSNELLEATRLLNVNAFTRAHTKIEKLNSQKKVVIWVNKTIAWLKEIMPNLAKNILESAADTCWDERIKQMSAAYRWAQARTWLYDYICKEDAPSLEKRERQIEDEIGKTIGSIASLRAWSFCFRRMTEDHRRHMEAWQQSMRKLGKGTGKHAPRHRREARKHLNECREAVPAWVMPLHRIWDTVDPMPGMFDMIVIDEASQCGFEALPLLYLGKKILIVGDDKQISPDAVGIPRDAVNRLMEEYLHSFKFKSSFDVDGSIFDHGKLRYGMSRITLREHFRCMPEIIKFSNDLCYSGTPLIPLRQYEPNRLHPLNHIYLQNGYREGSHNRVINRPEAEAIARKIVEICQDKKYSKKTIGVVVLQGDAQGRLIEELLLNRLDAEEMEKRRLVCGNPYSFQGDERDIVFLSMVAAPNERIGFLAMSSDERRFNVAASRARDQMWLFHSVTRDDLSTSCLRRRLLEFFEETKIQEVAGIDLEELKRHAHQTNRSIVKPPSPFDGWFEVDVALEIAKRNFHVIPQFEVAGKFIDLVVQGRQARLGIECDGDEFHGADQYEQDMQRQRMLERCGWVLYRIRASTFYIDREKALDNLWRMLEERGISPQSSESKDFNEYGVDSNLNGKKCEKSDKEETSNANNVEVGDLVVYVDEENPDLEKQAMITRDRSVPELGAININTPIAQALLGASIDQVVVAKLPMGSAHLRIKEIKKKIT